MTFEQKQMFVWTTSILVGVGCGCLGYFFWMSFWEALPTTRGLIFGLLFGLAFFVVSMKVTSVFAGPPH